jgi:ribosomal protein S18 acetylase RimI-like enzyme
VDRLPRVAAARALAAEADAVLGGAGLAHRRLLADDGDLGVELSAGMAALGWRSEVHAVMRWAGGDPPPAPRTELVSGEMARPAYAAANDAFGYDDDTAQQLLSHSVHDPASGPRLRRVGAREDPGGPLGSLANLYDDGATAEIDNVATLPSCRGRGLGREVMGAAIRHAHEAGCDLVFLRADEHDWPHEWYRRLGFETVGRQYVFSQV